MEAKFTRERVQFVKWRRKAWGSAASPEVWTHAQNDMVEVVEDEGEEYVGVDRI